MENLIKNKIVIQAIDLGLKFEANEIDTMLLAGLVYANRVGDTGVEYRILIIKNIPLECDGSDPSYNGWRLMGDGDTYKDPITGFITRDNLRFYKDRARGKYVESRTVFMTPQQFEEFFGFRS